MSPISATRITDDAIHRAAQEVHAPETIRLNLVDAADAERGVPYERILGDGTSGGALRAVADSTADVRIGAIVAEAQHEAAEQAAITATTELDMERIHAEAQADGVVAGRRARDGLALRRQEIDETEHNIEVLGDKRASAQQAVVEARDTSQPMTPPGALMEQLALNPRVVLVVGALDMTVTTTVLEPAISEIMATTLPYGNLAIAAGISAGLMIASGAAGLALAATKLPARFVSAMFVAAFGLIVLKLVPSLDALRAGEESGVGVLTAAMLASGFVAMLNGYATAVHGWYRPVRELVEAAASPLGDALRERDLVEAVLTAAHARRHEARAAHRAQLDEIERLYTSRDHCDVAVLARQADGVRAKIDFEATDAVCQTRVEQERAAAEWGTAAADLMWHKRRAESERTATADPDSPAADEVARGSRRTAPRVGARVAAIATVSASTLGAVALGQPLLLAAGAAVAGAVLLLPPVGAPRARALPRKTPDSPTGSPAVAPIRSAADSGDPSWRAQPKRVVAAYGGPDSAASCRRPDPTLKK